MRLAPRYNDGKHREEELLAAAYKNSMQLARQLKATSIAFPFLSTEIYDYPLPEAIAVAIDTISQFDFGAKIYLVAFDATTETIAINHLKNKSNIIKIIHIYRLTIFVKSINLVNNN